MIRSGSTGALDSGYGYIRGSFPDFLFMRIYERDLYFGNDRKCSGFSCFLKFRIVGDTADWMRAESSGIPPIGCAFWK